MLVFSRFETIWKSQECLWMHPHIHNAWMCHSIQPQTAAKVWGVLQVTGLFHSYSLFIQSKWRVLRIPWTYHILKTKQKKRKVEHILSAQEKKPKNLKIKQTNKKALPKEKSPTPKSLSLQNTFTKSKNFYFLYQFYFLTYT